MPDFPGKADIHHAQALCHHGAERGLMGAFVYSIVYVDSGRVLFTESCSCFKYCVSNGR